MSKYRNDLENYLKTLDIKADKVLDVGGSANPIEGRVKSWDVKDYKILDNNNEKGLHPKTWREPDYIGSIDMWSDDSSDDKTYDVIFCLEVLEYCRNITNVVKNIHRFLKSDGICYITTCWAYPNHNPIEKDRIRVNKQWCEWVFKGGFETLECIPRRFSPEAYQHLRTAWAIDGLHYAKGYPDHDCIGYIFKLKKK